MLGGQEGPLVPLFLGLHFYMSLLSLCCSGFMWSI